MFQTHGFLHHFGLFQPWDGLTKQKNIKNIKVEKIGKITEDWLQKWNVPYDELVFGKPYADIYIDDLGIEFSTKEKLDEKIKSIQPYIIIPMAGQGKRFKDNGITKPKFMIKVKNKSLFEWSLDSLPLDISKKII